MSAMLPHWPAMMRRPLAAALTGQRWLSPEERFAAQHERRGPDECWPWLGALDKWGRGRIMVNGKNVTAPAFALTLDKGPPPKSQRRVVARHSCDNPTCVNPRHLEWGTQSDNAFDAITRGRAACARQTHCKRGHPLSGDNLGKSSRSPRDRVCKACKRLEWHTRKARDHERP
jgi:hypothetical protein